MRTMTVTVTAALLMKTSQTAMTVVMRMSAGSNAGVDGIAVFDEWPPPSSLGSSISWSPNSSHIFQVDLGSHTSGRENDAPAFANPSTRSLPCSPTWDGTNCIETVSPNNSHSSHNFSLVYRTQSNTYVVTGTSK